MKRFSSFPRWAAIAAIGAVALTGCANSGDEETTQSTQNQTATEAPSSSSTSEAHEHNPDGGPAPEGIKEASDPTYAVGEKVILTADHMPGMKGAEATISGAFDTTTYAVSYTPTDGGAPVTNHKWVVHEELDNPGEPPLSPGTEVVLNADHMPGMKGATATIDSSTDETVYMVDLQMNGMKMTNHKWVVESEIQPTE